MSAVVSPEAEKNASAASLHGSSDALALARVAKASRPAVVFLRPGDRGAALEGRDRVVRAAALGAAAADWETLPTIIFFSAPRPGVGAPRDALPHHARGLDAASFAAATALTA